MSVPGNGHCGYLFAEEIYDLQTCLKSSDVPANNHFIGQPKHRVVDMLNQVHFVPKNYIMRTVAEGRADDGVDFLNDAKMLLKEDDLWSALPELKWSHDLLASQQL